MNPHKIRLFPQYDAVSHFQSSMPNADDGAESLPFQLSSGPRREPELQEIQRAQTRPYIPRRQYFRHVGKWERTEIRHCWRMDVKAFSIHVTSVLGLASRSEANGSNPSVTLSCCADVQSILFLTRSSMPAATATMGAREGVGCGRSAVTLLITATRDLFS